MSLRQFLAKVLVWLTFVWLAVMAGFFIWTGWTHDRPEDSAPKLIAAVDESVRVALQNDPTLRERLVVARRLEAMGDPDAPDVFSVVPAVDGAEPSLFEVDGSGAVIVGYRGTSTAEGICVRIVLSPTGTVQTSRANCRPW